MCSYGKPLSLSVPRLKERFDPVIARIRRLEMRVGAAKRVPRLRRVEAHSRCLFTLQTEWVVMPDRQFDGKRVHTPKNVFQAHEELVQANKSISPSVTSNSIP